MSDRTTTQTNRCSDRETGATAVEYALMVGLITAVIAGAVLLLGQAVLGLFTFPWP